MVTSDNPRKPGSCKRKRSEWEVECCNMERAKEVQANLPSHFPSFLKPMLPSNVTRGFFLSLPSRFCKLHLPRSDTRIVLVDGSGEEYQVNYLAGKMGLSGGWRLFSIAHSLIEGDVLVFHLVGNCKFKVYIVRTSELEEVDGALGLLHLNTHTPTTNFEILETTKGKCLEPFTPHNVEDNIQKNPNTNHPQLLADQSGVDSQDLGLVLEEIIDETIDIANAVEAFNISISISLSCTEHLRMKIRDLGGRMDHLDKLAFEAKKAVDRESGQGRVRKYEENERFVAKLIRLMEAKVRLGTQVAVLKVNANKCHQEF